MAPHDPRVMPEAFHAQYRAEDVVLPPNFAAEHPFDNGELNVRDERLAARPRKPDEVCEHIADYRAMIAHLDAGIGRILDALDRRGLADDTVVVMAGDNGLAVGQHGLMGKQSLHDHSVRVPLVLRGPGVPAGARSEALVYLYDVFPTLCGLCGVDTPSSVEGQSLRPALQGEAGAGRRDLYLAYRHLHRAVREPGLKLIECRVNGQSHVQLFDLQADPWETVNLAGDPDRAGDPARLRARMAVHADALGDRGSKWGKVFWGAEDGTGVGGTGLP